MDIGTGKEVVKRFQQRLPVTLTDDELHERQQGLVQSLKELDETELKKKEFNTSINDRIKDQRGHIAHEVMVCDTGEEMRSVTCESYNDLATLTYCVMRADTGEILTTRPMTDEERQKDLKFA